MAARTARLTTTYALNSGAERAANALYWLSPTGDTLANLAASIGGAQDAWWDAIKARFPTTVSVMSNRVDEINPATGHVVTGLPAAIPTNPAGTHSDEGLPLQCSEVLTLRTATAGGHGRGRIYVPGVSRNNLDALGFLATGTRDLLVSTYADFLRDVMTATGTDWEPAVFSRGLGGFLPIVSIDMGTVIDTQRKRRNKLVEARFSQPIP